VPGLGDERERMGADSGDEGHDDIGQRQDQGEPQNVLHLRIGGRGVNVHALSSLCRGDGRFNFGF
jgi:hypothetical protein